MLDIHGAQWNAVSGGGISIQDITLPVAECSDGGESMMVYTPGVGYATYYYYTDTIEDLSVPEDDWVSKGPGWATMDGEYVDLTLPAGSAYWMNTTAAKTFTVSGAVPAGEGELKTSAGVLNLYSIPFPISGNVQDVKLAVAECTDGGESMMVYTPGVGYATYYYYTDTIEDLSVPEDDWVSKGPGWATMDGEYVDVTCPVGSGFWLNTTAAKTFTVSSPL